MTVVLPIPVVVTRHQCPFCRRTRAHKAAAVAHIGRCWFNPAVRSCKTCQHLDVDPGGPSCFPERPCDCNRGGRECLEGIDLDGGKVVTDCTKWTEVAR